MSTQRAAPKKVDLSKESNGAAVLLSMHYPFISTTRRKLFKENIQGKKAIKERALDLESIGIDTIVKETINCHGWKKFC